MLKCYFDESGTGGLQQPVMTMAGWALDIRDLKLFGRHWRRVVNDHESRVPEAKASDLHARENAYVGWSDKKALQFKLALSAVLERYALFGVAVSVIKDQYQRVIAETLPRRTVYRDEYTWVMQVCLEFAVTWGKLRRRDRLACIFDKGNPYPGRTERSFYELVDDLTGPIGGSGRIVREYCTADSIDLCGLQAAEFLAWGVRTGTMDRLAGITPDEILIQSLHMPKAEILGGYYDEEAMRKSLAPVTRGNVQVVDVWFTPAPPSDVPKARVTDSGDV